MNSLVPEFAITDGTQTVEPRTAPARSVSTLQGVTPPNRVTFADIARNPRQAEKVRLREKAVTAFLAIAPAVGTERALVEIVAEMKAIPDFKISAASLRKWVRAFRQFGLDGVVLQMRGRVGRKPFADDLEPDQLLKLKALAIEHGVTQKNGKPRLNAARAFRELAADPTVTGPARAWLHNGRASKSSVPPSLRDAARVPLFAAKHLQIGPKAARLAGPYTECSYEDVPAGFAFTADDMTCNCYVWTAFPNDQGFLLLRPQLLAVADIGSQAWLNARVIIRPRGQYNRDDVWGVIGDTLDEFGLFKVAVLEGGTWQANVVIGEKTGLTDDVRFGGLRSLGVKVIHTRSPRGKIIEQMFDQLQYAADNCRGYCGRNEKLDRPESVKKELYAVEHGHAHPREFFLNLAEYREHVAGATQALLTERNDGKVLRGLCPADKFAQDDPQFEKIPDSHKWLFRSAYRKVNVTANGVRITVGSGKYQTSYTYADPALEIHRGRNVIVFWNDVDPDTDACVYTIRAGEPHELICVASRLREVPRFGTSEDDFKAEATRKKMAQQQAVALSFSLSPFLRRRQRVIPAGPSPIGENLQEVRDRNTAAKQLQARIRRTVQRGKITPELEAAAAAVGRAAVVGRAYPRAETDAVGRAYPRAACDEMSDARIAEILGHNPFSPGPDQTESFDCIQDHAGADAPATREEKNKP